jgi:hypothetical protein
MLVGTLRAFALLLVLLSCPAAALQARYAHRVFACIGKAPGTDDPSFRHATIGGLNTILYTATLARQGGEEATSGQASPRWFYPDVTYPNLPYPVGAGTELFGAVATPPGHWTNHLDADDLKVYELLGSEVATPANGEFTAGHHAASVDAARLSSGIYIAICEGDFRPVRKIVLVR